jgi:hypothetical protein
MRQLNDDEYKDLLPIIKHKMAVLAEHENKNCYLAQPAKGNCYIRPLNKNTQLYQLFSPGFINMIETVYLDALNNSPHCFGTHNAKDVIHALRLHSQANGWFRDDEQFANYLSKDQFCLLLCKNNNEFSDDLLRIDLFREIKDSPNSSGNFEFVGGLFHALKHFSVNDQCASVLPKQKVNLYDVEQLIWPIAKAFYEGVWKTGKKSGSFESQTLYLNKKFTLGFYREEQSGVSFINTLIPSSI